jgi:hypothetical protein
VATADSGDTTPNNTIVPPGPTVLALGGYHGLATVNADGSWTYTSAKGNTSSSLGDDSIPYCYDLGDGGTPGCEAGVYVGPGAAGDGTETGGMLISSNGAVGNPPVVLTNSDIAVKSGRNLTIASPPGTVSARGRCSDWSGAGTVTATSKSCDKWNNWFEEDPMYSHRRVTGLVNRDGDVSTIDTNVINQPSGCAYYNNTFIFRPGIYTVASTFNDLMNRCQGLYWFQAGTYYFDITWDSGDYGQLRTPPRGNSSSGIVSQVVGGAPPTTYAWSPPDKVKYGAAASDTTTYNAAGTSEWNLNNGWSGTGLSQTSKVLQPTNAGPTTNWPTTALTKSLVIDGYGTTGTNGTTAGKLQLKELQTQVPSDATKITNVKLDLSYLPETAWDKDGLTGTFAKDYPRIDITPPSSGWGTCTLVLPSTATLGSPTLTPLADVDIAAACTASSGDGSIYDNLNPSGNRANNTGVWVPTGTGNPQWRNSGVNFSGALKVSTGESDWTPALVNNLTVEFQSKSRSSTTTAQLTVDGLRLKADYKGRPAPAYPGGCNTGLDKGVQLILGGWTHISWSGQNTYTELCGSKATDADPRYTDPYGIALYAVGQWENDETGAAVHETATASSYTFSGFTNTGATDEWWSGGTRQGYANNGNYYTAAGAPGTTPNTSYVSAANDGKYYRLTMAPTVSAGIKLAIPAGFIPAGAYVDSLQLKVRYSSTGTYQNTTFKVDSPSGSTGSWSTASLPSCQRPKVTGNVATFRTWLVGGYYKDDTVSKGPDEYDSVTENACPANTPAWANGSQLMRTLQNPDGTSTSLSASKVNGATITLEWEADGAFNWHEVIVDQVEMTAQFRRPSVGTPVCGGTAVGNVCSSGTVVRPLRGCLTTRPASQAPNFSTGDPRIVGGASDWDYGARFVSGVPATDTAYEGVSSSGNGANDDNGACSLLYFDKYNKFHISGTLYAPTGAIDIRGNDNQASFVNGQTVARSVTAYRWVTGQAISAYGEGGSSVYNDRTAYIRVYATSAPSVILAEQKVKITDHSGVSYVPGSVMQTLWYKRRGET